MRKSTLFAVVSATAISLTAQSGVELEPVRDNTLYASTTVDLSNGAGDAIFSGISGRGQILRGMLAFDVAGSLPPGATVLSAELQLSATRSQSGAQSVDLHRLLGPWGEAGSVGRQGGGGGGAARPGDATWVYRFLPTSRWTLPGGDFTPSPSASFRVSAIGPFVIPSTAALVADVQHWLDHPEESNGWILRGDESGPASAYAYGSREAGIATDRPVLRITYRPPTARTSSFGRGCAGSSGTELLLHAVGSPTVPQPAFALQLTGGPGGAAPHGFGFALARATRPIPLGGGCFAYLDPSATIAHGAGDATRRYRLPIPDEPALLGFVLLVQGVVLDPVTARLTTSHGLELRLGR